MSGLVLVLMLVLLSGRQGYMSCKSASDPSSCLCNAAGCPALALAAEVNTGYRSGSLQKRHGPEYTQGHKLYISCIALMVTLIMSDFIWKIYCVNPERPE